MKFNIVNCFCTKEISSGNPAAIVRDFMENTDKKQELAKKLNLPVTVFLSEVIDGTCNIEFFYPETEMPLCLHGTVGAAYIVANEEKLTDITFITKDKNILKARVAENSIQICVSSKAVPSIIFDELEICKMLNLNNVNDIDLQLPFLISFVGSPKLLIPLKSFEILSGLKPDFNLIAEWSKLNSINGLYVYTKDISDNDLNFYARGFNPKGGYEEDAATGVAAAALSLALKQSIVVGQGKFINRPSKIIVSYDNTNIIWVGGNVREQIKNIMNEDMKYTISYDPAPKNDDTKIIWQGISEHAAKIRGLPPGKPFSFFIRDELNQIKGGCSGYIYYGCFYVDLLWVDESIRGKQYGSKLMKDAEKLAQANFCNFIAVNTMDFEALEFYKKLGFAVEKENLEW